MTTKTEKQESSTVEFTNEDAVELYHMIKNRGHSWTRTKILYALRSVDPDLADRIEVEL